LVYAEFAYEKWAMRDSSLVFEKLAGKEKKW